MKVFVFMRSNNGGGKGGPAWANSTSNKRPTLPPAQQNRRGLVRRSMGRGR